MFIAGVLAVWLVVSVLEHLIEGPKWAWLLLWVVLGTGWQLLVDWDEWYLGIGIGGGAGVLILITDLLLVLTDWTKVSVLRRSSTR